MTEEGVEPVKLNCRLTEVGAEDKELPNVRVVDGREGDED